MDQWLIGALSLVVFVAVVTAYEVGRAERKSRNEYEPTETGVLPRDPVIMPMPPVQPTRGRRPF